LINGGEIELSGVTMNGCKGSNGGAIYSTINEGGKLYINESSSFTSCESTSGNGGAIYVDINYSKKSYFEINEGIFTSCLSNKSADVNIRSGYGSGIFLKVNDWINSSNGIDLSGA
jgi:hypothetical protein